MLPQAATKSGNGTELRKCPLLCRQKGRLTCLPVRQANRPIDQPAGFPDGQSAGQPENRPTDKQADWKAEDILEMSADKATPYHLLPQAATKGGNGTELEKCPLLCRQKGR
ncbi:hypothetical protein R3O04_020735 [Bacteroides hominis]|uniref:hypothetical protein n=1 Tax=Bacteroides hominis TaxID=2763023 RepID=UPI003D6C74A4